ncbi:uncharacterized protein LOC131890013 isoform X2 [Tigriopus californicus]|uniref:uncharacterized protein LOC131890013 isoform X2 n=1 Tax=Tigriopus californicus TaxID=6832 RepID=UPI0027DA4338|nr:uncharacterized protein LOC131890013 isoform X2 [Tigriopus californicus]
MLALVLAIALLAPHMQIKAFRTFKSTPSGNIDPKGMYLLSNDSFHSESFSLCVRADPQTLGGAWTSRLWMISDWFESSRIEPISMVEWIWPRSFFIFGIREHQGSWILTDGESGSSEIFKTHEWNHVCFSFDYHTKIVRLGVNGRFTNVNGVDHRLEKIKLPSDLLQKIYLGRCPWNFTDPCSKHNGMFTDFNLWDRPLSPKEILDWTGCRGDKFYGNVVDWRTSKWKIWNMEVVEDYSYEQICRSRVPGITHFPTQMTFEDASVLCSKMRSSLTVISDEATQNKTIDIFFKHHDDKDPLGLLFWNGWSDQHTDTVYQSPDGRIMGNDSFQPWYPGEPNGGKFENCGVVWPHLNAWNDEACSTLASFFCTLQEGPIFWMRGLPKNSKMDSKFSWTGEIPSNSNRYILQGYTDSLIFWDVQTQSWKLELSSNKSIYAEADASENYPLGLQNWTFHNAPELGRSPASFTLSLSACNEEEFNCANGVCISMSERCNNVINCPDKSDEIDCKMIQIDDSYIKHVPPIPILDQKTSSRQSSQSHVFMNMEILEILEISEVDYKFTVQYQLNLKWFDPALTFANLKENSILNAITVDMMDDIWLPQITFENTKQKDVTQFDKTAFGYVVLKGSKSYQPRVLSNTHTYQGSENPIVMKRIYSTVFSCDYQLRYYPFEKQECFMEFSTLGKDSSYVSLEIEEPGVQFKAPKELTQYYIVNFTAEKLSDRVRIRIEMKRRIIETILTTYVPSLLICVICHCTVYFRDGLFKAVVTVNITCLLCLITMFTSVSDSLPKTSYVKMIGIWLFMTICVPFLEVLLATWIHCHKDDVNLNPAPKEIAVQPLKRLKKEKVQPVLTELDGIFGQPGAQPPKMDAILPILTWIANYGIPSVFILFVAVYWIIGVSIYMK